MGEGFIVRKGGGGAEPVPEFLATGGEEFTASINEAVVSYYVDNTFPTTSATLVTNTSWWSHSDFIDVSGGQLTVSMDGQTNVEHQVWFYTLNYQHISNTGQQLVMPNTLTVPANSYWAKITVRKGGATVNQPYRFAAYLKYQIAAKNYKIHRFTTSGIFEVLQGSKEIEYMVVAGGAGTERNSGYTPGLGAGGVVLSTNFLHHNFNALNRLVMFPDVNFRPVATEGSYTITVAAGSRSAQFGAATGNFSKIEGPINVTATGGGGIVGSNWVPQPGGNGCGGLDNSGTDPNNLRNKIGYTITATGGTGIAGGFTGLIYKMGNSGGPSTDPFTDGSLRACGGGGGFLTPGEGAGIRIGGTGGSGIIINFDGTRKGYSGGGGGGANFTSNGGGVAGIGGGGVGGFTGVAGGNGEPNTGGGAGGGAPSGTGGSGIIIIRYEIGEE
jgi:hypothetical protein